MVKSFVRVAIFSFLTISTSLFFLKNPILQWIGSFLIVADTLEHADAIVVLSGDPVGRCQTAADLFMQGWAPRILITRGSRTPDREQLKRYGIYELDSHEKCFTILTFNAVPESIIEILDGYNESTSDEVYTLQHRLQKQDLRRVIIVTSNFHTRRSRLLFRRALWEEKIEVGVYAAPPNFIFDPHNWWTRPYDRKILFAEYQKLFYYVMRYW